MIKNINIFQKIKHYFYDLNYEIPFLVVVTGQKCTLKCKNCANFCPYHSPELDFYDVNLIIKDLKNIIKRIKSLGSIQIQGGGFFFT